MSEDVLKITIVAAGEQAKAELQKVAGALQQVGHESHQVAQHHQNFSREAQNLSKQLEGLAKHAEYVATGFRNFRAIFAGGAVTFGFAEIINQTVKWDEELVRLSHVMNENVESASRWMAIAENFEIPVEQLRVAFRTLSQHIQNNSPILRELGIATQDTHGKLLSFDQILEQLTKHFRENAGATTLAGQARDVFGRADILPALVASEKALAAITKEAEKFGLVINKETLVGLRQMEVDLRRAGIAFHALILTIGHEMLPALAAAGRAIHEFIQVHLDGLRQALNNLVSFIIGFFEYFSKGAGEVSDTAREIAKVTDKVVGFGDASETAGSSAGRLADAERAVRDNAKDATSALEDQIRVLEEGLKEETFADQQIKLEQRKNDEAKKVAKLRSEYQNALLIGDFALGQGLYEQITAMIQTQANTEREISHSKHQEETRHKVDALREQIRQIQKAADEQVEIMRRASQAITTAMTDGAISAGESVQTKLSEAGKKAGKKFAEELAANPWGKIGETIGTGIAVGIGNALHAVKWGEVLRGIVAGAIASPGALIFGMLEGAGIHGMSEQTVAQIFGGPGPGSDTGSLGGMSADVIWGGAYAGGGIIPGPIGMPKLAMVHGGEEVRTPAQQQGKTVNISMPITIGSVDSTQRADELARTIRLELVRVQGLM